MKIEKMITRGLSALLERMGLERRRSASRYVLPAIGLLTVGILLGGVVGRLLLPARRPQLREPSRDAA